MGIQFYNGLSNMNYRMMDIPRVKPEDITPVEQPKEQAPQIQEAPKADNSYSSDIISENRKPGVADLENISLTFNKEEDFSFIGKDASVKSLDMEKAISDMKKDGILEEYQYFVGNSRNLYSDEDGIVIPKNN
ncbi:MAG: hypothetical protein MJ133_10140 [Lachnospiraceae bacterium]|nr:hypothetical protein [Lachnospiraceae bacterium]